MESGSTGASCKNLRICSVWSNADSGNLRSWATKSWIGTGFTAVAMRCSGKSITHCSANRPRVHLFDEHTVSVGIETVAFRDRMFVGAQHVFFAAECADQHEQRG